MSLAVGPAGEVTGFPSRCAPALRPSQVERETLITEPVCVLILLQPSQAADVGSPPSGTGCVVVPDAAFPLFVANDSLPTFHLLSSRCRFQVTADSPATRAVVNGWHLGGS